MKVLVAGHICLDLIPELPGGFAFDPGKLIEVGPAALSTGGAVSNTGLALRKLGVEAELVGKVGEGILGQAVLQILERESPGASRSMRMVDGAVTSYTVVINPPSEDRTFLHCPGANETFGSDDVPDDALTECGWMHLGYPPLLRQMYENDGAELEALFRRAKTLDLVTSLDMSLPDPDAHSGRADWATILKRCLPLVDFFLPSAAELQFMLGDFPIRRLAEQCLDMGAGHVGVKVGTEGILLLVGGHSKFWREGTYRHPCFQVEVAGTTGSGDAAVAGFIASVLRGLDPEETLRIACAVGAACCERPDAVSGVPTWQELQARLAKGWTTVA